MSLPVLALMAAALTLLAALVRGEAATLPCVLVMVPSRAVVCALLLAMHLQVRVGWLALLISLQVPAVPKLAAVSRFVVA